MGIIVNDGGSKPVNLSSHTKPVTKAMFDMSNPATPTLAESLSVLLADTFTVYFRAHGYHWNVKGDDFATYHELFEEIYKDLYGSVDGIAENIRKIDFDAPARLSDLIALRRIQDSTISSSDDMDMSSDLLVGITDLLGSLDRTFNIAQMANEQGVANFIADRIDMTKKWKWKLTASTTETEEPESPELM